MKRTPVRRGLIIGAVRELAASNADVAEIHSALSGRFKRASIYKAIDRARHQGDLPKKAKVRPGRVVILLKPIAARRLEALALNADMRPSEWARSMLQRAMAAHTSARL